MMKIWAFFLTLKTSKLNSEQRKDTQFCDVKHIQVHDTIFMSMYTWDWHMICTLMKSM